MRSSLKNSIDKYIRELKNSDWILNEEYKFVFANYHDKVEEILNIQSKSGKAKPYQVKQIRNVLIKYRLKL